MFEELYKMYLLGKGSGYYLVEFSYDQNSFIIHISDIETNDKYIKKLAIEEAEDLLKNHENDYDSFAESLKVRGNQVAILKQKRDEKNFSMDLHASRN